MEYLITSKQWQSSDKTTTPIGFVIVVRKMRLTKVIRKPNVTLLPRRLDRRDDCQSLIERRNPFANLLDYSICNCPKCIGYI